MSIKLDSTDWKILNQLDINCRQSDAEIGKKTRLSKQVVNYRIKKLMDDRIITAFFPHIDIAKLGYGVHKIYLQFGALTKEKEEEMWMHLSKQQNIIWAISCSGKWDLIFGITSKSMEQFDKVLSEFTNKYSEYISNRAITVFNKAALHHRKWLLNEKEPSYWQLGGGLDMPEIDEIDKKILKSLNEDARKPIIKIGEEAGTSSSLAIQRIRKLQQKGIIGGFRTALSREKLGMNYCKAFVYYQNKTSEKERQLLYHCHTLPNILGVSQSIGPWDLELEFEVRNYDEFHKIMKDMKNKYPLIRSFDTAYIEKEHGLSFLPGDL